MINNENVDIFLYTHIPFTPIVKNKVYKILTCSDKEFDTQLPVLRDYTGDNISDKNLMYNEYTGLYWLWKNYQLKDYVGLNHYRRIYNWTDNVPDIDQIFKTHDIILNEPIVFSDIIKEEHNNYTWYGYWHNIEDFYLLEDIINTYFSEYKDGFNKMKNAEYIYNSSMFIMRKNMFIEYCEFVFSVLGQFVKQRGFNTNNDAIKWVEENKEKYIKPYLPYYNIKMQSRIIGYIAERVLNVFLMNGEDSLEKKAMKEKWSMVQI